MVEIAGLEFTREEILDRIADKAAHQIFGEDFDEEGCIQARIESKMHLAFEDEITAATRKIAESVIGPRLEEHIANIVIRRTNEYGEKKGEPVSFIEHLVKVANEYVTEQVDAWGKTRSQGDYSWKPAGARVAVLIDKHLHYAVSTAVEQFLKEANKTFAEGLAATVKLKLQEAMEKVKVTTSLK